MKRLIPLVLAVMLCGCSGEDAAMNEALELRSRILGAQEVRFQAELTARYIDTVEEFTLECVTDPEGKVSFTVTQPEEIAGITGSVNETEGALTFDGTVLAFPLLADDRLSPVSGPWVVMKALRSGSIIAVAQEGELLHLTIDDSYADDALTVDVWARDGAVTAAEISWQGKRVIAMEIEDFTAL